MTTMDHVQKERRALAEHAPRSSAAILLRHAAELTSEAASILSWAEDVPELDDVTRLMLAVDDLVARLTGDDDGRTGYVVSAPPEDSSVEHVIHDPRTTRRAAKMRKKSSTTTE